MDCPNADSARSATIIQELTENGCSETQKVVSAMPAVSTRASPYRLESGPVTAIWQIAATTPVTANAPPTSCGPHSKRACVHSPNTDSMPLKAQPARNVTSISRLTTGLVAAVMRTAQRLGLEEMRRCTRLSFRNKTSPMTHNPESPDAKSSGMRKPAWQAEGWTNKEAVIVRRAEQGHFRGSPLRWRNIRYVTLDDCAIYACHVAQEPDDEC